MIDIGKAMLNKIKLLFFVIVFINPFQLVTAENTDEKTENIANIYIASMEYISKSQSLINTKGTEKASLFGEKFISEVIEIYQHKFQKKFPSRSDVQYQMMTEVMIEVMEDNRTLLLDKDIGFKGLIPSVYAFQLSRKYSTKGIGVKFKFTNESHKIRNMFNEPDNWEIKAIEQIKKSNNSSFSERITGSNNESELRYMTQVALSPVCLNCHGSPKDKPENIGKPEHQWTNIDSSGFKMENWKLSDFGGAISVTVTERMENNSND